MKNFYTRVVAVMLAVTASCTFMLSYGQEEETKHKVYTLDLTTEFETEDVVEDNGNYGYQFECANFVIKMTGTDMYAAEYICTEEGLFMRTFNVITISTKNNANILLIDLKDITNNKDSHNLKVINGGGTIDDSKEFWSGNSPTVTFRAHAMDLELHIHSLTITTDEVADAEGPGDDVEDPVEDPSEPEDLTMELEIIGCEALTATSGYIECILHASGHSDVHHFEIEATNNANGAVLGRFMVEEYSQDSKQKAAAETTQYYAKFKLTGLDKNATTGITLSPIAVKEVKQTHPDVITIDTTGKTSTGVDVIEDDSAPLGARYYDLRGMPVDKPQPGAIYIKSTGQSSQKIVF